MRARVEKRSVLGWNKSKCISEFMMRSDEYNRHSHGSYAEETAPSSNVNVTDED